MAQVQYCFILYSKGEFWYISDDLFDEKGNIRSHSERGDMFPPQQGWIYRKLIFSCTTVRLISWVRWMDRWLDLFHQARLADNSLNLITSTKKFRDFSGPGGDPCIFPFIYKDVEHWGCRAATPTETDYGHGLKEGQVQIN